MIGIGKILIIVGCIIVILGLLLVFHPHIPYFGKLPGDITIKKNSFTLFFPVVSFLLISIILTIVINIIMRILNK